MQFAANIVELSDFIKCKHYVHQSIKNMVGAIRVQEVKRRSNEKPKPAAPKGRSKLKFLDRGNMCPNWERRLAKYYKTQGI